MPAWMTSLLHYFSLPEVGLPAIFAVSFVSATILPMATEPVLFSYVKLNIDQFWWAIIAATIGNTTGGMLTYWMGYGVKKAYTKKHPAHTSKHFFWLQRLGAPILLLSWLPIIGDALCAMAGWVKLPWKSVMIYMALGKLLRFIIMTLLLLWIPNGFWSWIGTVFT